MPRLRFLTAPDQPVVSLVSSPATIGRAEDNLIVLPRECSASRHHAELTERDGVWSIRDLGSLNGTLVNDVKIEWPRHLEVGDLIKIGDDLFQFEAESAPASRASSAPTSAAEPAGGGRLQAAVAANDAGAPEMAAQVKELGARLGLVMQEMGRVIVGQKEVVNHLMMALVARGHVLMVGLPGLAKTLMIRTLAEVLDLRFRRIQFTPDLMPSDITGTDVLEVDEASGRKNYRFIRGPIFTNILLADEINRTPPKTQAALLEAMQEYHVTASGETYPLHPPFFVLATQNPLEQEGTYPLPEAQLDRFMFSLKVDYPSEAEEERIAQTTTSDDVVELGKVLGADDILAIQRLLRRLPVSAHVVKYATRLARATRPAEARCPESIKKWIYCGAGPRATQYLLLAAKAGAVLRGSVVVNAADVRAAAHPVLRHRIFTNFTADSEGVDTDQIIDVLLKEVKEPGEGDYPAQG